MATSRNKGKHYQPVLCRIKLFPASGKSVVVIPHECTTLVGHVLPFKGQVVLLQWVQGNGELKQPTDPSLMTPEQHADCLAAPWVIAWVQNWLIENFEAEGRAVELMTPAAPIKEVSS